MPDASQTSSPNRLTACIERLLFRRRALVLAAFALITLAMGWYAAQLRVDAGFFKLVPLKHELHEDLPQAPGGVRQRGPGGDRAHGARRRHVHPRILHRAENRSPTPCSSCPGSTGPRSSPSSLPTCATSRWWRTASLPAKVLPADFRPPGRASPGCARTPSRAGVGGRLVANDFTGAIVSGRLQEFHPTPGGAGLHRGGAPARGDPRQGASGRRRERAHHRVRQAGGDIAAGAARVIAVLRHHVPDHRPVRVPLHAVGASDHTAAGVPRWWQWWGSSAR